MKKILLTMIIMGLFFASSAFGASKLLNGATATGTGIPLKVEASTHVFVVTFSNASTMVLAAEGYDGYTWTTLGTYTIDATDISAGKFRWDINSRLTDEIRPNITTLSGGGATVTVTVDSK